MADPDETATSSRYNNWEQAISKFLTASGLTQSAIGFERDMLVLSPTQDQMIHSHIHQLVTQLTAKTVVDDASPDHPRTLDERKSAFARDNNGYDLPMQGTINRQISAFLARNRAKNDASNRAEFLQSLENQRRQSESVSNDNEMESNAMEIVDSEISIKRERLDDDFQPPSRSARTSARPIDRGSHMKYDIARNDDGPLRRATAATETHVPDSTNSQHAIHLGLHGRLVDIEEHLSIRYVPTAPNTFLDRLKCLEEHLMNLEREYPPWAALHFAQPRRGWPPPPRQSPIIVPAHMTYNPTPQPASKQDLSTSSMPISGRGRVGRGKPRGSSSLAKAVKDRLEVQKAKGDLAGYNPTGAS